jgi:outer membrane protein
MIRHSLLPLVLAGLAAAPGAWAQTPLTLGEAIDRARSAAAEARMARLGVTQAEARVAEARAGYLPQVDASESWTRGDQPVYVFGSLLNQRRFSEADFAIDALNHPDALANFRASLGAREVIWDGGAREARVQAAGLGQDAASVAEEQARADVALATAQAYGAILRYEAAVRSATAAVAAAEGDVRRARDRLEAGMATDADVSAFEVRLAAVRAARAHADAEAIASRAALNQLIGAPLDAAFTLDASAPAAPPPDPSLDQAAVTEHPDVRAVSIREGLARAARRQAHAAFLPAVSVSGGWEWNGATFGDRASSWLIGAEIRWNLFNGLADRARAAAAGIEESRAAIDRTRTETAIAAGVRSARARLDAARSSEVASRTAVASAHEAERITRDRYEHGMADATSLLHASQAVMDAEAQATSAAVDVLVQTVALERALGRWD